MTKCTKCGKSIGLFESYEYNQGNPLCMDCYGKSDKQIEEENKKDEDVKLIEKEIGRLEKTPDSESVLLILGIIGIFFFIIPGIIFLVWRSILKDKRKTKIVELKAQLITLKQSKRIEHPKSERKEGVCKYCKTKFREEDEFCSKCGRKV